MDLLTLCSKINLQPEIKNKALSFEKEFDFKTVEKQLNDFSVYENMNKARAELQTILGEDPDKIKMLACMLKASAVAYETYQEKGIPDEIYVSTMKCYTRFIDETFQRTGRLFFDRDFWTTRQAGCHLFRIGELEYERIEKDGQTIIEIHIPSDADFSPSAVDESLECAKKFFREYYPEAEDSEYRCDSWLLDSQLKGMLKEGSNIIHFQNRFELLEEGEAGTEFLEWVFHKNDTGDADYAELPEDTSLQRNMKKHLLSGGVFRSVHGRMKEK